MRKKPKQCHGLPNSVVDQPFAVFSFRPVNQKELAEEARQAGGKPASNDSNRIDLDAETGTVTTPPTELAVDSSPVFAVRFALSCCQIPASRCTAPSTPVPVLFMLPPFCATGLCSLLPRHQVTLSSSLAGAKAYTLNGLFLPETDQVALIRPKRRPAGLPVTVRGVGRALCMIWRAGR